MPFEISMKYQQKSIGNPVELSLKTLEIKFKFPWNSIGKFNEFNRIVNEIPIEISIKFQLKSIWNPIEIQQNLQWNNLKSIGNSNWKHNTIAMEIQLEFNRNFNEIPMKIH